MDGAGFALAQSLRRQMSPVVMVLSTPRAEESCQRNDLSFVDLLRPFCSLGNINVPVRTASEQSYRLTEFHLRMFYSSEICQLRTETAEEYLVQVVNDSNDAISGELDGNAQDVEVTQMIAEADSRAPAFQEYSREFMRTLSFSDHEAVDHPVACVLLVSSSDANPISKFVDLYSPDHLPALLNEGTIDPKLLKLFVILHDNQDGPVDRADELLLEMRSNFGVNNCRVLCINSASPYTHEAAQSAEDMWGAHLSRKIARPPLTAPNEVGDGERKGNKGLYINKIDVEELTDFVLDLSVKHVIPLMEVKIRTLYQQVSATRKGLKNQIKNLWLRKGKDDVPDVLNGPLYTYSSVESQIRVLADYSFMLHDYELALSNYRLLSSDYKTDKAWKRYAGVQEMIGLSLFMLDQSRRESELCMETAINYYQKSGRASASYATRSSLWLAEMHKAKTQYREAAVVLSRASTEEATTRAGLLLEQAANCYLHTTPPMLRKYGFHLVLAGNQYANCFQRKLAAHVYRSALNVFGSRDWNYIHDHVYFHLGRLATLLGNHANAVLFFKRVIASSRQSPINQAKFLAEFLFVIQSTSVQGSNLDLDLPIIDVEHVGVHVEDQRTYASPAAASVPEKVWSSLEDGLVPGPEKTVLTTWLDARTVSAKKVADFSLCVAGEEIGVDVEFRNPLQIPLDVSDVSLVFRFVVGQSDAGLGAKESLQELKTTASHQVGTGNPGEASGGDPGDADLTPQSSVNVSKEEFTLQTGEKSVVRLKVTPLEAGVLKVVGVRWTLSGIATGQRDFAVPKRKEKAVKKHKSDEPTSRQHLNFHVLGNMPRLDVSLHEIPGKVNAGEVRRLVLELSNPSTATLKAIKLKTSHPLFLLVGEAGDLDQEFPSCLEVPGDQIATSGRQEAVANTDEECSTSGFTFSFPKGAALEGGSTLLWPLWLHAREAGTISLNTVIYYEPNKSTTSLLYRTVRLTHTLQVLPSLKIGVQITPSPSQLQQYLLRLDIENNHSSESFWLRQVSCAGNQWSLAPLPPPIVDSHERSEGSETLDDRAAFLHASVCPSQLLPASQSLSLFFKLLNVGQGKLPIADELTRSTIGLGPPGSTEPLIDITSGPLPRFLFREKLEQPQPSLPLFLKRQSQVAPGIKRGSRKTSVELAPADDVNERPTVDVILISEQQDGMSEQQDGTSERRAPSLQESVRVVVHDICHCSVHSPVPIVWVAEGPKCVRHDFASEPSCEVPLLLMVRNCSVFDASVRVETFDAKPLSGTASTHTPEKRVGWYPLAAAAAAVDGSGESSASVSDAGGAAALAAAVVEEEKVAEILNCGPYMWCNARTSSSIPLLRAGASAEVRLRVTFFGPGTYDLSRYQVSWSLLDSQHHPYTTDGGQSTSSSGPALQQTAVAMSPQKQDKSSEPTFASGFAAVAAATPAEKASSATRGSQSNGSNRSPDRVMSGSGQGHSLLMTVLENRIPPSASTLAV